MEKVSKKNKPVIELASTPTDVEPKRLTSLEFERLERARVLKDLRAKEQECLRLKQQAVKDRRKVLELTARCYDLDDKLLFDELTALETKTRSEKDGYDKLLGEIKERLAIAGKFGYHHETLEIVEDAKP
jgi:hypothetical protein